MPVAETMQVATTVAETAMGAEVVAANDGEGARLSVVIPRRRASVDFNVAGTFIERSFLLQVGLEVESWLSDQRPNRSVVD